LDPELTEAVLDYVVTLDKFDSNPDVLYWTEKLQNKLREVLEELEEGQVDYEAFKNVIKCAQFLFLKLDGKSMVTEHGGIMKDLILNSNNLRDIEDDEVH
jgi:hypothetical protein